MSAETARAPGDRLRCLDAVLRGRLPPWQACFGTGSCLLTDKVAISAPVLAELREVLNRANLARFIDPGARASIIDRLTIHGVFFTPLVAVSDCRDEKDNIYLELALAASAHTIVSSDLDLLVLHPWRGVRILRPAHFLALP
jgi:putative PIN family toxin of toxin-antitoxin system